VKILTHLDLRSYLDLNKNELRNAVVQVLATPPASPSTGQIYYNSDSNDGPIGLMVYNGTTWEAVGNIDSLSGTAPINVSVANGVATISISAASAASAGSMSAAHFSLVDGATSSNTVSTIVKRDADGDFDARDIEARNVTLSGSITQANHAATKAYVDSVVTGLDIHDSVHVATTANLASLSGLLTIDGHTLQAGERVLVKNQTDPIENGVYDAASGAWTRSADSDGVGEIEPGTFLFVEMGSTQADTGWVCTTNGTITPGTDAIVFTQFSGAGTYLGGDGLTLAGNTFSVNVDNTTLEINTDVLRVKDNGITSAKMADGSVELNTATVTGTLGTANGGTGVTTANANVVFAGPTTGAAAAPTFRALVADDIPNHGTDKLTSGTLGVARGGTGASTFTAGFVKSTGGTNALTTSTTVDLATEVSGTLSVANGGTGNTNLTSGGVLIGNGTSGVQVTLAGTANQVLRVPTGGGNPTFGAIDISSASAVTGTLAIANGGTGGATAAAAKTSLGFTTKYSASIGDGSATTITITHSMGTKDVTVEVYENASPYEKVYPDIAHGTVDTVDLTFASAPTNNQYRVVVIG
jgi:hypothetical protein